MTYSLSIMLKARRLRLVPFVTLALAAGASLYAADTSRAVAAGQPANVLWQSPTDIQTRDLFWGPGGKEHAPEGTVFEFIKEDLHGTSPKYVVKDKAGVKWKVKLGAEAKPETVATRLVWAVGYSANEDYFLPEVKLTGLPAHLHRGHQFFSPDGIAHDARLKREPKGEEKDGVWKWSKDPFLGTREYNGLRTLMAVMNNWDVKDENNAIVEQKKTGDRLYIVKDLGATFGTTAYTVSSRVAKGNPDSYAHSKFITKVKAETINVATPGAPPIYGIFAVEDYIMRWHMTAIGKNIPRRDAKWMGSMLASLSPEQINDAFRAAGYSPTETANFTTILKQRIAALNAL